MKNLFTIIALLFVASIYACPTITVYSTDVNCYLGTNGSASATINGPNGPFTCTWSTGANTTVNSGGSTSITNMPAGVYSIYVKDQLGCTSTHVIAIEEPSPVTGSITNTYDVNCNGGNDGSIDLDAVGGTPGYSFSWSNGSTSQNPSGLVKGTYSVTITDANGCTSNSISAIVDEPANALTSTITSTDAVCFGSSDGTVDLSPSGGTSPYTFSWNNGAISEDLNAVPSGTYSVTITDNNGCTATNSISLSQPTNITSSLTSSDVSCFQGTDGSVDLTVNGGITPYSYQWANANSIYVGTTEDLNNIPASTYFITVTDNNGCQHLNNISVYQPTELTATLFPTDIPCHGDNTGSIINTVNGGTPPYSYVWSNGATSQSINSLIAGTYTVNILDAHGCSINGLGVTLVEPLTPLSTSFSQTNVTCNGFSDGLIDLNVTGGTYPYLFDWNAGQFITEDLDYIPAGSYTVLVTDDHFCTITDNVIITEPAALVSSTSATNVLCFADTNGMIDLTINGGTTPYEFQWGNTSSVLIDTAEDLINYPANTYYIKITDSLGCTLFDEDSITQPDELIATLVPTHILCFGDSTGAVDNTVTGGVLPYLHDWNNQYNTEDISNLPYGWYVYEMIDNNTCFLTDSVYLTQPLEPLYAYYEILDPSCYGYDDGQVSYTVEGGTAPYQYLWNRGDTVLTLFDVASDTLICITTDTHNCTLEDSIFVLQPDSLFIDSVVVDVTCFELSDGSIDVTVSGGTQGYDFYWTNSTYELSVATEDLINYPADEYLVQIVDSNACEAFRYITISEPPLLEGDVDIQDVTCFGNDDGIIEALITGGNIGGYTYAWNNGETTYIIDNLPPGIYETDVFDTKGCMVHISGEVHEPEPIVIEYELTPLTCRDIADAALYATPTGGNGGFTFAWDYESQTGSSLENIHFGNYPLTVTDILGCTKDSILIVPEVFNPCLTPPEAFTPEGDGYNDIWYLENIELYPECEVLIYNKWGKVVFESNGYSSPWNGMFKGHPLPSGTYYYAIKIIDDAVYTGPVTIVR